MSPRAALLGACVASIVAAGCAPAPEWSADGVLAPTLAHLDDDGDGRVLAAEYDAHAHLGQPFAEVDTDGDGVLSLAELRRLADDADPAEMTGPRPGPQRRKGASGGGSGKGGGGPGKGGGAGKGGKAGAGGGKVAHGVPPEAVDTDREAVRLVLEALCVEVRAVAPDAALPDAARLSAAAESGGLSTETTRAVLAEIEVASTAAGLGFPRSLRAAANAGAAGTRSRSGASPSPQIPDPSITTAAS